MIYTRRYSYKRVLEGSNDQIFPVSLPEYERGVRKGVVWEGRSGGKHFERVKNLINEHQVQVKNNGVFGNFILV